MFLKFKYFFINVKLWFPILISDRQWDGEYLYDVIRHKLSLMEKLHRSENAYSFNHIQYADEIKFAIDILDRIIEDDYLPEDGKEYYEDISIEEMFNSENKASSSKIIEWITEENDAYKEDRDKVFNYIRDNIDRWWD